MTDKQEERTEYGLRVDCAANGCGHPHLDDGEVLHRKEKQSHVERVNGHAVTRVRRTVTYSPWTEAPR